MYLGRRRLFEEKEGVVFIEVAEGMDALLLLGLHHKAEKRAVCGNTSPFLLLEGQDTENVGFSEVL